VGEYRNNPQLIEKIIDIQNQYKEAIDLTKLANKFNPDWDGLVQYLMNNPELNNATKNAEEAGMVNAEKFFHAYLNGINTAKYTTTDKKGNVTVDYDAITTAANKALTDLTSFYNNNSSFAMAFDNLQKLDKTKYASSTEYHQAAQEYLNALLSTITSEEELKKYLPGIKAAFGDMFTSMTVSFNEAAGHAVVGKAGSNSNFTTAGEKIARGFAETWTKAAGEGAKEGKIAIGDMILHIGDYDMTASLEKMF
jgi:hypothetical protein